MPKKSKKCIDPLYELFEHYLLNRSFEDSDAFTKEVAEDYLAYLDSTDVHVPFQSRQGVLKDLEAEAHEMLIKKMYGCVRQSSHRSYGKVMKWDKRKKQIKEIEFTPPVRDETKDR